MTKDKSEICEDDHPYLHTRQTASDYTPGDWERLLRYDVMGGVFWVGSLKPPITQSVWVAADDFRHYTNRLLDAFGHLTLAEVEEVIAKKQGVNTNAPRGT
jgi:hypothetical protein